MENFHWKEYWSLLKDSLLRTYHQLTEEDLSYEEGKEEVLISRLKRKLKISANEVNEVLFIHLIGMYEDEWELAGFPDKSTIDLVEFNLCMN